MKRKSLAALGVLMILAALSLTLYNFWSDNRAGTAAQTVLAELTSRLETQPRWTEPVPEVSAPDDHAPEEPTVYLVEQVIPDHILNPNMDMPVTTVDGKDYIGYVDIPSLKLQLPIIDQLSDSALRTAPCRYKGSVYTDDMILAGHNYRQHFGKLTRIAIGTDLTFTDMDGNVFCYQVVDIETIPEDQPQTLESGDWDLTLFTCTLSRTSRITVRCERVEQT